jgi:hypothetical protein
MLSGRQIFNISMFNVQRWSIAPPVTFQARGSTSQFRAVFAMLAANWQPEQLFFFVLLSSDGCLALFRFIAAQPHGISESCL